MLNYLSIISGVTRTALEECVATSIDKCYLLFLYASGVAYYDREIPSVEFDESHKIHDTNHVGY